MLLLSCICQPVLDETCLKVWKHMFILGWIFCLRRCKELNSLKKSLDFSPSLPFRRHGIYRGGEWENTQQPYVFWNKDSALGKNTFNLWCMYVWTSSRIPCPWDWLPSRALLTLQGGAGGVLAQSPISDCRLSWGQLQLLGRALWEPLGTHHLVGTLNQPGLVLASGWGGGGGENTEQFFSLLLCATSNDLLAGGSEGFAHSNLDLNWVFRVGFEEVF